MIYSLKNSRIAARVRDLSKQIVKSDWELQYGDKNPMKIGELNKEADSPENLIVGILLYIEELETKRVPRIMQESLFALHKDYLSSMEREFSKAQTEERMRMANINRELEQRYVWQMTQYRRVPWFARWFVERPVKSYAMPRTIGRPQPSLEGFLKFVGTAEITVQLGEI